MSKITMSPVAQSIPFDTLNLAFKKDNVQEVFEEIRKNTTFTPEYWTTSNNTTENLTESTLNFVNGTGVNYRLRLPNATTVFNGQNYIIVNKSSTAISIVNQSDMSIFELLADSIAVIYLRSNSTVNGIWDGFIVSGFATGILSYTLTSQTPFTTTSSADVLITGFSLLPVAGEYSCWYSQDMTIQQNNRLTNVVFYRAGTTRADTRRTVQGVSNNFRANHQTLGIISVNGNQSIDVRVNISAGQLTVGDRSLVLIRLGPEVI